MVRIELSDAERGFLITAINEWGGPAMRTEALTIAMGFADVGDFGNACQRFRAALLEQSELSLFDWARILVLAEFVFVSDVFGSGVEWPATTGLDDCETLRTLRGLQRKLTTAGAGRSQFR